MAAYQSPRTIWPSFDWSNKDFAVYVNQEIASRLASRQQLTFESHIPKLEAIFQKPLERDVDVAMLIAQFTESSNGSLKCLPKSHGVHLSICNQLCTLPRLYSSGSLTNHIKWLTERAEEISRDDVLLQHEGVASLDDKELILACLRRGLFRSGDCREKFLSSDEADTDPDDSWDDPGAIVNHCEWSPADLRNRLQQWLDFSRRVHAVPPHRHPSLLVHAIAVGIPLIKKDATQTNYSLSTASAELGVDATSGVGVSDSGRYNSISWKKKHRQSLRK